MPGVLGAASIPFIGCVSLLAGMILQILSFASPFWASDSDLDFGLWRRDKCIGTQGNFLQSGCYQRDRPWDVPEWLDAVRAMEALTIIFWAIPLITLPVYIYVALGLYYKCILATMTVSTLLGVLTNLVGVIIFGIKLGEESNWTVGWCYVVCVVANGFGIIAFIVFLVATCNRPEFTPERHFLSGFYVDPDKNRMYVVENVDSFKGAVVQQDIIAD